MDVSVSEACRVIVCTDGHSHTKKAQDTKTLGDQTPEHSPAGEAALVDPDWVDLKSRTSSRD